MSLTLVRVCCAVVIKNGLVFAGRRGRHKRHALLWEFPGGKVEEGESDQECLQRELREELQMEVSISRPLPLIRHAYDTFEILLIPFLCHQTNHTITAGEHEETAWLRPDDMKRLEWSAADERLVSYLLEEFF